MLTVFDNDENIFDAIKAGADGYLLKEVNPTDLHQMFFKTSWRSCNKSIHCFKTPQVTS